MGSWLRRGWRRWRGWRHRRRCSELTHQIDAALQDHDLARAVEGLEQQLRLDCSHVWSVCSLRGNQGLLRSV